MGIPFPVGLRATLCIAFFVISNVSSYISISKVHNERGLKGIHRISYFKGNRGPATSLFESSHEDIIAAKDAEIEELKMKLAAYQKYMADYIVNAAEEKTKAVDSAVTVLKIKHAEELKNAMSLKQESVPRPETTEVTRTPNVESSIKEKQKIPHEVPSTTKEANKSSDFISEAKRVMSSVKNIANTDVSTGVLSEGKGNAPDKVAAWNARTTIPDTSNLPATSLYEKVMQEDQAAVAAARQQPESPSRVAALNERKTIPDTSNLPASSLYEKVMQEDQAAIAAAAQQPQPAAPTTPVEKAPTPVTNRQVRKDGDAGTTFAAYTSERIVPGPLTGNSVAGQSSPPPPPRPSPAKATMAQVKHIFDTDVSSGVMNEGKGNFDEAKRTTAEEQQAVVGFGWAVTDYASGNYREGGTIHSKSQ